MTGRVVRRPLGVAATAALLTVAGCHRPAPSSTTTLRAERTVFTDSTMHAHFCQPTKPGEDWRRVCTPLDQSVAPVRRLP